MKTLYLDCGMGAAGDMLTAALLELLPADKQAAFLERMNHLGIPGVTVTARKSVKCGIQGTHVDVMINGEEEESLDVQLGHEHHHDHGDDGHGHEHFHHHDHEEKGHRYHPDDEEHGHSHDEEGHDHEHHHHDEDGLGHEHLHGHGEDGHDHEHHHGHDEEGHGHEHHHGHDEEGHGHEHHHHDEGHGHEHHHGHDEEGHDHEHHHHDENGHGHHHHHHVHMSDLETLVGKLDLPDEVKADVLNVYRLIAEAESKAHGVDVSEIHFHEVGMMDAVADVAAVCLLMHEIAPQQVIASPVHVGSGKVRCAHGIMPVPAPATAYLLQGIPMYSTELKGELCTPTGAALLKYYVGQFSPMPAMQVSSVGYGMGKKDFPSANCVRVMLGESFSGKTGSAVRISAPVPADAASCGASGQRSEGAEVSSPAFTGPASCGVSGQSGEGTETSSPAFTGAASCGTSGQSGTEASDFSTTSSSSECSPRLSDTGISPEKDMVVGLSCNVDDMTAEEMGFAMELLLKEGAREAFCTPVIMKKSRPGLLLTVLCSGQDREHMIRLIFRHTSTIGIRETSYPRYTLKRSFETIETPDGPVRVKHVSGYGADRQKAEFDDVAAIALKTGKSIREVRDSLS